MFWTPWLFFLNTDLSSRSFPSYFLAYSSGGAELRDAWKAPWICHLHMEFPNATSRVTNPQQSQSRSQIPSDSVSAKNYRLKGWESENLHI